MRVFFTAGVAFAVVMFFVNACTTVTESFSDWRQSANDAEIAIQTTKQTAIQSQALVEIAEIETDGKVKIAKIETDGAVEIAKINANRDRDTSLTYVVHRVLTMAIVFFFFCMVAGSAIWFFRNKEALG